MRTRALVPRRRSLPALPRARALPELNWFDRFLLKWIPSWGAKRVRARAQGQLMSRFYDAAGSGRRGSGWHRSAADVNAVNRASIPRLREISRDLRRNNGYARRAVQIIANNVVGWGIEATPLDANKKRNKVAAEVWKKWADTTACDFDGRMTFGGIQRLVMETVVESGECLVIRERVSSSDEPVVGIRIRVLEPDFLAEDMDRPGSPKKNEIAGGIEFDDRGRRVAYWLYDNHPGSAMRPGHRARRIPAESVLHVFQMERPGQHRGVPWLAAAAPRLHDFDEYEDAVLIQQKVAACFGAFVRNLDGAFGDGLDADADDDELDELEPGAIQYLKSGQDVTFAQPPAITDQGSFSTRNLRRIAASMGVTHEDLTFDYSGVNYSSARMARLAHWANVYDWRWNTLIPQLCDGVWGWVMEAAQVLYQWPARPRAKWSPPPPPMLDPSKEGRAFSQMVRSGMKTLSQAISEQGYDLEEHLAEIERVNEVLDEKGIVLDSDPRRTTGTGQAQSYKSTAEEEPIEEPADDEDEDSEDDT